jgi:cellulose synthase/poly-beta-1,6-N-acetylglucosamine synthase-like glycosyltransferase
LGLIETILIGLLAVVALVVGTGIALSLAYGKSLKISGVEVTQWPIVTVVVPTFNESDLVVKKVSDLLSLDFPRNRLEILVVDDSTDDTHKALERLAALYPGTVRFEHRNERRGLASALDVGYRHAAGSIVIKSDCDAEVVSPDAIKTAVSYLLRPDVGAITSAYQPPEKGEMAYRNTLHRLQTAESNLDSAVIAHGAFFAFKKTLYAGLNPNSLADDTEVMLSIRKQGYRTILVPSIRAYENRPGDLKKVISQRSRRARGILRLYAGAYGGMVFNPKYGRTGMLVIPLELAMMVLVPVLGVLIIPLALILLSALFGVTLLVASLTAIVILLVFGIRKDNIVVNLAVTEIASLVGLLMLLLPQSGVYDKVRSQ